MYIDKYSMYMIWLFLTIRESKPKNSNGSFPNIIVLMVQKWNVFQTLQNEAVIFN